MSSSEALRDSKNISGGRMKEKVSSRMIVTAVTVWFLIVAAGLFAFTRYKSTPGDLVPAPGAWPPESGLARTAGIPTLVMSSHPRCPCTRASIAELNELMSQFHDRLTAYVLFVKPAGVSHEWTKTDLWQSASRIAGVHVVIDENGIEAARFDALTSGQVVLYDGAGRLQFSGGITGARGHIGDNLGLRRVISLLSGEDPDRTDSPVFGCPLHDPEEMLKEHHDATTKF